MVIQTALLLIALAVPPTPTNYVTDAANVLDDTREHVLNEKLAQLQREDTAQILVYVDRKLPANTTIAQFGAEAIRKWAPGTAEKDNGAILLLFVDDRESRIEVGYGLEERLTDAKSKRVLVSMRDALRVGDYIEAVEQGVGQMTEVALGRELPAPPPPPRVERPRYVAPAPPPAESSGVWGCAAFAICLLAFVLIIVQIFRQALDGTLFSDESSSSDSSGSSSWSSSDSSSSFSSDSSSSSSSSSSYDSGGGSGGGGGASDKW